LLRGSHGRLLALCFGVSRPFFSHLNFDPWAVLSVKINQGVASVFAFYLISGFFTAAIFDRHSGPNKILSFYFDRTLRIYPMFLAVMLIVIAIGLFHHEPKLGPTKADYHEFWNWYLGLLQPFNGIISFFLNDSFPSGPFFGFTPVATLALEVRYFVIYPLVERLRDWMLIVVCLVSTVFVVQSFSFGNSEVIVTRTYRDLFGVLPLFVIGYMVYRNVTQTTTPWWARGQLWGPIIGIAIFASIKIFQPVATQWAGELAVAYILTPSLLVLALKVRTGRMDHLAGYLSYGIFLAHIPIIRLLHLQDNRYLSFAIALSLATGVSLVLHFLIERRVLAFRHHIVEGRGIKTIQT
jgi:peptidoglycan/LPS O-acetylase OafA/YrhL